MSQPVFSFDERIGLLFTVEAATLSICAVSIILCYALVRAWRGNVLNNSEASDSILFLNLMFADLIQGIGTMPNIRWMNDGYITEGPLCTAQAATKQVGIVGVAMTSLAIALYTFFILVMRKDRTIPKHTAKVIVAAIWIFVAIVIGIPNIAFRNEEYYGPTVYWCWILATHESAQIATEYLWVWIAALSMLIFYPVMFLLMRGWIGQNQVAETVQVEMDAFGQPVLVEVEPTEAEKTKKVAQKMLYYPLIYLACTLPNTASRWMMFTGRNPSSKFSLAANTIFALSGFLNFVLFLVTRPSWVVGNRGRGGGHQQQSDGQAGGHGRPPAKTSEPALRSAGSSSSVQQRDTIYGSSMLLSPESRASRSLHTERRVPSSAGSGEASHGFLPPSRT